MSTYRYQSIISLKELQKFVEGVSKVEISNPGVQLDVTLDNDKDLSDLDEYMLENNFEFVMKL